jgi:hypothetical protein
MFLAVVATAFTHALKHSAATITLRIQEFRDGSYSSIVAAVGVDYLIEVCGKETLIKPAIVS